MEMKKQLFYVYFGISLCCISLFSVQLQAQGCVAVRHMSCAAPGTNNAQLFKQENGHWQVSASYRNFKSFRHFVGDEEQTERIKNNTQVINKSNAIDFGISYLPNLRWTLSVNIPYQINDRSSLYEHYGNSLTANPQQIRFYTGSRGIGDLRFSASYWMIDPAKFKPYNFSIGLGVKLPTGNYKATDNFHKLNKEKQDYTINKPVDQSIQLGDGGVGASIETQAFYQFTNRATGFFSGFYLFNPKSTNGIVRNPESTTTDPIIKEFSVTDQYAARLGVNFGIKKGFSLMAAGRIEGVPSSDLIGDSYGFRRPGYIISAEPGVVYMDRSFTFSASVPVSIYRNRTKSYYDKQDPTGLRHGDAAFADYLVSITAAYRF